MALGWNERGAQEEHNGALRISLSASREEQPQWILRRRLCECVYYRITGFLIEINRNIINKYL